MRESAINELYGFVADINPTEITEQIKADNLSMWCNSWRITAKAVLRAMETEEVHK